MKLEHGTESSSSPAHPGRSRAGPARLAGLCLAATLWLAGCGGGGDAAAPIAPTSVTVKVAQASAPADPGARTRSGRYLSDADARLWAEALVADGGLIEVQVESCCGADSVELATGLTWGEQAARDLPNSVPVLVRGADLRLAAAVVERLGDGGLTHVWLVTP